MTYRSGGVSYLVCPRLLELDPRHGEHGARWPNCRRGQRCVREHEHEVELVDTEGHSVAWFVWQPGSSHADEHAAELTCDCGRRLVHGDLDDPWTAESASGEVGPGGA